MLKPYTKQWIYDLLLKKMPIDVSKDKPSCNYLRKVSKTARKAYLIGVHEGRAGKPAFDFRPMPSGSSDLEQSAWRFVFECYMAGTKRKE